MQNCRFHCYCYHYDDDYDDDDDDDGGGGDDDNVDLLEPDTGGEKECMQNYSFHDAAQQFLEYQSNDSNIHYDFY